MTTCLILGILSIGIVVFLSREYEKKKEAVLREHIRREVAKMSIVRRFLIISALFVYPTHSTHAQTFVQSAIPDNGSPTVLSTPYSQQTGVLIAGHFSNPAQTLSDLVTFDASGNLNCLSNTGNEAFQPVVNSTGIPVPLTAGNAANFGTNASPTTDSFFVGNASTLTKILMSNCTAAIQPPFAFLEPDVLSIAQVPNGDAIWSSPTNIWIFNPQTGILRDPSGTMGATAVSALPPNIFPNASWAFFITFIETPLGGSPVTFALDSSTFAETNSTLLTGSTYLGTTTPNLSVVAITATNNEIFLGQITVPGQEPVANNIGSFSVPSNPIGVVIGNFLGGTFDLAVASSGGEVDYFAYHAGPSWTFSQAVQVGSPIAAITHGNFVSSTEDDVAVQSGGSAIVLASSAVGIQAATPTISPSSGTYSSPQSITISDSTPGVQMFYTVDGSQPTTASAVYSGPINIAPAASSSSISETITALAAGNGYENSQEVSASFTVNIAAVAPTPPPPTQTPSISIVPGSQQISAGGSASYQLAISGFTSTPTLSATASIPKGSCVISGTPLPQLVCTTTGASASSTLAPRIGNFRNPIVNFVVFALAILAWISLPRRRRATGLAFAALLLACSCGGGHGTSSSTPINTPVASGGTPSGQYMLQVNGVSGTQTASAQAGLTIQ